MDGVDDEDRVLGAVHEVKNRLGCAGTPNLQNGFEKLNLVQSKSSLNSEAE